MYEHGWSFHLLISSLIHFFKDLKFLLHSSFTCLVRLIPRYFLVSVAIVKDVASLNSVSAHDTSFDKWKLLFFFFELTLYLDTSLKVFIHCRNSLAEYWRLLMYTILSSANRDTFQFGSPWSLVVLLCQIEFLLYVSLHLIWCRLLACYMLPL